MLHPSIIKPLSTAGLRGQQPKQRPVLLSGHLFQLFQGYPQAFPGKLRHIVSLSPPGRTSSLRLEILSIETV